MDLLLKEPHNHFLATILKPEQIQATEDIAHAFTVMDDDRVLACGGVTDYWPGRGECWATFTKDVKKEFVLITRAAKTVIDSYPGRRVEASVRCDFEEGHRWIRLLGFKLEAERLEKYLPDGSDVSLYSKVK